MVKIRRPSSFLDQCRLHITRNTTLMVAAAVSLCFSAQIFFAFFGSMHPSNELASERNVVAESLVSSALAAQMNIWPPHSVCQQPKQRSFRGTTAQSQQQQQRPFLSLHQVRKEIKKFYRQKLQPQNKTPSLEDLGQLLLKRAKFLNQTLLTVQVGATSDSLSKSPLHQALVKSASNDNKDLRHWMPIVVESAADNFAKLSKSYQEFLASFGISCSRIARWAMSNNDNKDGMCELCRFRKITPKSPSLCKEQPAWLQTQAGIVDCRRSEIIAADVIDQCSDQEKVECGSTLDFFQQEMDGFVQAATRIAILDIYVGGQEHTILRNLIHEFEQQSDRYDLPPVIHYGSEIMRTSNNSAIQETHRLLKEHGFVFFEGKQHDLAIQVPSSRQGVSVSS